MSIHGHNKVNTVAFLQKLEAAANREDFEELQRVEYAQISYHLPLTTRRQRWRRQRRARPGLGG
jgi:hypothetical protein